MATNSSDSSIKRFSKGDTFDGEFADFPKFKDLVITMTMANKSMSVLIDDSIKYPEEPSYVNKDGSKKKESEFTNRESNKMREYVKLCKELNEHAMSAVGVILGLVSGRSRRR